MPMFNAKPRKFSRKLPRNSSLRSSVLRLLAPATLSLLACAPVSAQIEALRQSDDQFIRGLRERGMSDLLERFVEKDPPKDPIAQLALEVALKEFIADERMARASEISQQGGADAVESAIALFNESRTAYEQVLAAQKRLIAEHASDERLPLWQTDYAEMLVDRYLPRYFDNANWVYEFGLPSEEQRAAFESAMVEALVATADASFRLDDLPRRLGQIPELKPKLEAMGIWFTIEDYRTLSTPYWLAQSAHGVSLIPDSNPYYQGKTIRAQKLEPVNEKQRLRGMVVDALANSLMQNERTKLTARLFSGRTLVWSSKSADIDDGVDLYLDGPDGVITKAADQWQGYIATLAKAVGRWNGGELATSLEILGGMDRNIYVQQQLQKGDISPRLLAADLMFRILTAQAKKAPPSEQPKLIAQAYEQAYVSLIDGDADPRFRNTLFERWANSADSDTDPASLPPAVRMGIGEQLTLQGGFEAERIGQIMETQPPVIQSERDLIQKQREAVEEVLNRAVKFNETLIGQDMQGPILARGLYNLGMNKFSLARLEQAFNDGNANMVKFQEVADLWLQVGLRVPEATQLKEALVYSNSLAIAQDRFANIESVTLPRVRDIYKKSFELLCERWPLEDFVQDQRVYAGFYLYEKPGDFAKAVEIYRALPNTHNDYFQARRQMLLVLQRQFRTLADQKRLMESTRPADDAPELERNAWAAQYDKVLEDLERMRADILEEAGIVILDAEDEVKNGETPTLRFTAATATGAAKIVLAGVQAEAGQADKALELLEGFEKQYAADGPYAQLAELQQNPEGSKANLQGLVQSAQEQRIIALLDAGQAEKMAEQARVMMDASPDVAAAVVNGVLERIRTTIDRERRAEASAAFERQKEQARENIKTQATFAVKLGELLVQWAGKQGFDPQKMTAYRMPLAESLILAGRTKDALAIMQPIAKAFPTNFSIRMKTGRAYIEVYRTDKSVDNFNNAHDQFAEIIKYYNARSEKPDMYWDAWLQVCTLKEIAGGEIAKQIPEHARMLLRVDENLGGPNFKDKFMTIFDANGGVQRLPKQP